MTVNKKDVEDLSVQLDDCTLNIKYPDVNYSYWKSFIEYKDDLDIIIILENLLVYLDCTVIYSNSRVLYTNQMMYEKYVGDYYYYLLHFDNQLYYNTYFDLLCKRHQDNVEFEFNNPILEKLIIAKSKAVSKKKVSNKFVRQVTTDLITGQEVYIYINGKDEPITSNDPNLLDKLNNKEKKVKQPKRGAVPMSSMTFSFKKKQQDE